MVKESLGRIFGLIHRQTRMHFHREFQKYGLGSGGHIFILILSEKEGISQKTLTDKVHFDKAHTTRMIQKLIDRDYVIRKQDEDDKRVYRLFLAEKGKQLVPELQSIMHRWHDTLLKGLSEAEKKELTRLLQKIASNTVEQSKNSENQTS
jgi:DNA-binding MarR family transcriptional regulator